MASALAVLAGVLVVPPLANRAPAAAQSWTSPKKKAGGATAAKPGAGASAQNTKKRPANKKKPKPPPDEVFDAEIVEEQSGEVRPTGTSEDGKASSGDGASAEGSAAAADDDDWGEDDDADTSDDKAVRFDDALDDVGADVTFSKADLTSDAATGAEGKGVTRLETLAMAYARLAVDTVHDQVPVAPGGLRAFGENVFAFRAHGRAEGTTRFGQRMKVKVAGRVNADLGLDAETNIALEKYETEVWDTYLDFYLNKLDIRFGKQFITWGTADLLSPNDVVNARDLRRGYIERPDELRLPVLALSTTAYAGPFSLQGIWVPVAPTNRFELLEGDYAILGPNAATPVERRVGTLISALADDPMTALGVAPIVAISSPPDNGIRSGELGASASLRTRNVDLHAYFLWGHERNPRIQVAPLLATAIVNSPPADLTAQLVSNAVGGLAAMGTSPVEVDYPRRTHVGAALATRLEPFGLKLEGAYSPETTVILVVEGAGAVFSDTRQLPQAAATVSLDYDRGTSLNVILEGSYIQIIDVPADRRVFQMPFDHMAMVGSRIQWQSSTGLVQLRFLGLVDVLSPSYALKPALRLSGHDNISIEFAAGIYGGPEGSFGGIAGRNDEVMFTVQYGL